MPSFDQCPGVEHFICFQLPSVIKDIMLSLFVANPLPGNQWWFPESDFQRQNHRVGMDKHFKDYTVNLANCFQKGRAVCTTPSDGLSVALSCPGTRTSGTWLFFPEELFSKVTPVFTYPSNKDTTWTFKKYFWWCDMTNEWFMKFI